jgi:hypothetical protein
MWKKMSMGTGLVITIFLITLFTSGRAIAGSDGFWIAQWIAKARGGEKAKESVTSVTVSPEEVVAQASEEDSGGMKEEKATEEEDITKKDGTGTDPRGFGAKLLPYYWYGELDNEMEVSEFHLFGMIPFEERIAVTIDWPMAKQIDYSDVDAFRAGVPLPPSETPGVGGGGIPFDDLDRDGDVVGMGDLNFRFFWMPEALDRKFTQPFGPNKGKEGNMNFIFGAETWIPTATEDILGNDAWIVSPLFTFVVDTPTFGFLAAMNFLHFDLFKEDERPDTLKYIGRWFLMQPLTKPGPWYGGIYLLPEFQPIYDFENDDFSLWVGPELGKMLAPGRVIYAKPGFGIDPEDADRKFTVEIGFRWFF